MTDKEIITGLERCITGGCGCTGCAYNKITYYDCDHYLKKDALNLIKSQQAEIESLERANKILSKNADDAFQDGLNEAQDLYAEQVKNEVKAEAIKEFADELKDRITNALFNYWELSSGGYYLAEDCIDEIDDLVKEMVGTDNE